MKNKVRSYFCLALAMMSLCACALPVPEDTVAVSEQGLFSTTQNPVADFLVNNVWVSQPGGTHGPYFSRLQDTGNLDLNSTVVMPAGSGLNYGAIKVDGLSKVVAGSCPVFAAQTITVTARLTVDNLGQPNAYQWLYCSSDGSCITSPGPVFTFGNIETTIDVDLPPTHGNKWTPAMLGCGTGVKPSFGIGVAPLANAYWDAFQVRISGQ